MTLVSIKALSEKAWKAVCRSVKNACVYMDNGSAEALHWNGGAERLLSAGALHIAELSPFEVVPAGCQKAVFVMASAFAGDVRETVREIIASARGRLLYAAVLTAVPPSGGATQPENLEEELLEWMGNANFTAEVAHISFDLAPVADDLLIMPGQAKVWSALSGSLPDDVLQPSIKAGLQEKVKDLVASLDCFLGSAGVAEECFYVGSTSRHIAAMLASGYPLAVTRRRKATVGASLLVVDRVLDLVTCLRHDPDSFLDRVLQSHTHFACQQSDVAVNMQPLVGRWSEQLSSRLILHGCLAPTCFANGPDSFSEGEYERTSSQTSLPPHEAVLNAKSKVDALGECLRRLTEASAAERLPSSRQGSKLASRVSPGEVLSLVQLFRSRLEATRRHCDLLQVSLAVCSSLESSAATGARSGRGGGSVGGSETRRTNRLARSLDKLCQLEKVLMQAVGEGETFAAAERLSDIVKHSLSSSTLSSPRVDSSDELVASLGSNANDGANCDDYSPRQLLGLVLYLVSLTDGQNDPAMKELQHIASTLMERITQDAVNEQCATSDALPTFVDRNAAEQRLRAIASARSVALQHHRYLIKTLPVAEGMASPPRLDPLLKRLVADAINCETPLSSTDIKHVAPSGGIAGGGGSAGSLLKSGLGLFKSKSPAAVHPGDKGLLIVFVVGGATASEVKHCREALASAGLVKTKQVVVVSTRLLSDKDVVEDLLTVSC